MVFILVSYVPLLHECTFRTSYLIVSSGVHYKNRLHTQQPTLRYFALPFDCFPDHGRLSAF